MTHIIDIFINPKTKNLETKEFKFELIHLDDPNSNRIWEMFGEAKNLPMYVWMAVNEKQKKQYSIESKAGLFSTTQPIDTIDLATLIDLTLGYWQFYFIPDKIRHDSLSKFGTFDKTIAFNNNKDLSIIPSGSLSTQNCKIISQGINLLKNKKNRRLKIAFHRFAASYKRKDPLDSILDCCSCLEALYNLSDELRLKIALISFHLVEKNKKRTLKLIYEMYGKRNDFIHGNKIPEVSHLQVKEYIIQTANILISILKKGNLPTTEELSKKVFNYYT